MAERSKRRRLNPGQNSEAGTSEAARHFPNPPLAALADTERSRWRGFCEIESEPALFNVMLKEFGVVGVKVQEIVSLDDEMMAFIHKPIYGLIFLFRWREDDPDKQEQSCPEGLWFANQTANYACASVALLNIINNIPEIELGEHLQQFKDFTMPFTPALRGDAIGNFEFVKTIHNSFARKMDVLNIDLQLKNESRQKRSSKATKKSSPTSDEEEAGFHFIAFVPVDGKVWKFDGLERQPQCLDSFTGEDWLGIAKPEIISRMAEYEEDQIEFSILSLVKDPVIDLTGQLALNIKSIRAIDDALSKTDFSMEEREGGTWADGTLYGPDPSFGLSSKAIDRASIPKDELLKYESASQDELLRCRHELTDKQKEIRASIKEEHQSSRADEDYATSRRHDYSQAVHTWVQKLARKKLVETLAEEAGLA